MQMTFRWFGPDDPIPLAHIRQIPGVTGIVTALYDVAIGDEWPKSSLERIGEMIDRAGLQFAVVESIAVHEDIKLGRPTRDRLLDQYCASVHAMGALGVPVLCYNFMPIFDWTRTDLAEVQPDGSTALSYDDAALSRIDLSHGTGDLPGWSAAYDAEALRALLSAYASVDAEQLWENLAYFLERVVPEAERAGVRMAIHPDDPPWSIFGLPRIITTLGCKLSTVVGSNVMLDEALPRVVAPATEMLGSRLRLVNCATVVAGQPHCVASKPKSGGPISSRQYDSEARILSSVPEFSVVTESITPPLLSMIISGGRSGPPNGSRQFTARSA